MTAINDEARELLDRLRWMQQQRIAGLDAKTRDGQRRARIALDQANGLLDAADSHVQRAALLIATNPPESDRPIPVVFGPQDAPAVVTADEVMAMVRVYLEAAFAHAQRPGREVAERCAAAWGELNRAVDALCRAAPAYEMGGGRTS